MVGLFDGLLANGTLSEILPAEIFPAEILPAVILAEGSLIAIGKALLAIILLLLAGDFISTFVYHVPEHALGRLHCQVHHEKKQTFQHYAVLSTQPLVMLDGLLGALPYLLLAIILWPLSPIGTVMGLLFGECHVVWRHTTKMGWKTPIGGKRLCDALWIVTPEAHWVHHENGAIAFGDIFSFFDQPAQQWLKTLILLRKRLKKRLKKQRRQKTVKAQHL
ncbi:MAG: sterol desaturase family protein [Cyanobacteria bacterium P01_D01_bin.105]